MADITTEQVWRQIDSQVFAVLGMVSARQEARTVGVVYVVQKRRLYIATLRDTWKARHVAQNPNVSITIPIAKRIPLMPFLKIPAATITFSGVAQLLDPEQLSAELIKKLFMGTYPGPEDSPPYAIIEVTPRDTFITYGIGVSLMGMRDTQNAKGRAPVS